MPGRKNIFVIIGSASSNSSNEKLIDFIVDQLAVHYHFIVFNKLKSLPHFDPALSVNNPPEQVVAFRQNIEEADGIIICTPEYVFSIPAGLKNALEWCVSTTVLSNKPTGLITASASGQKGHKELQLIMKTLVAKFTEDTTLLIQGIKGKVNETGEISKKKTIDEVLKFTSAFKRLVG